MEKKISFLQMYKTCLVGLKLLPALPLILLKKYYLCLKMLSYICSQTIATATNYYLLPWERREIVQGILGGKKKIIIVFCFSASIWDCCVSWVGVYCSAAGAVEGPFGKPLLAKCSANTSFLWNVTYRMGNLRWILDFKAVSWRTACFSSPGLGGWGQEEEQDSKLLGAIDYLKEERSLSHFKCQRGKK